MISSGFIFGLKRLTAEVESAVKVDVESDVASVEAESDFSCAKRFEKDIKTIINTFNISISNLLCIFKIQNFVFLTQ
jgi:hypothetical protein